ncbi:MAG: ATP-binding cassette domain-containing protein [Kineosporiaceae bacterium]
MLVVKNVFQGYSGRDVIAGLTHEFGTGVNGLLGPNGAGKTTLLLTLAGLLPAKKGEILVGGQPLYPRRLAALRRKISMLPQNFRYPPRFTVSEYIQYGAWVRGIGRSALEADLPRLLSLLDLNRVTDTPLVKLSGGTLQRVGIAQSMAGSPPILILDEPTVGLDPQQRLVLRDAVKEYGDQNCVIVSTHIVEDLRHICDEVLILNEGRTAFSGPISSLEEWGRPRPGMSLLESGYLSVVDGIAGNF